VSSRAGLVLGRSGQVDFGGTDAKRKLEAFAGRVAPDQVRELAFVLVTSKAVKRSRALHIVAVPDRIELELTPPGDGRDSFGSGSGHGWGSSAQTQIAFALVDEGAVKAQGDFTWPEASDPVDDHASELVRVLEAGLVRGCAPARLPRGLLARPIGQGGVSRIDADPARQASVHDELARTLEALRKQACPNAR
jgi:hypothetical protein